MDSVSTADLNLFEPMHEDGQDIVQQVQISQDLIHNALLEYSTLQQQMLELHHIHNDTQQECQLLKQELESTKKNHQEKIEHLQSSLLALQAGMTILQQENLQYKQLCSTLQQQIHSSTTTSSATSKPTIETPSSSTTPTTIEPPPLISAHWNLRPVFYFSCLFLTLLLALLESWT